MKFRVLLLSLLLAIAGHAGETVPALPTDGPPSPAAALPGLPQARSAVPGIVPGVRLQSDDKVGRTYAEGSPFIIWGGTRSQRSNLFTAAGLVRRAVLDALHLPDEWSHPIIIQLRDPLATGAASRPPVWTVISQVEGGFRLEINLAPRRQSVPGPLLRENLVRAILADRVLAGKAAMDLSGAPTPPPDWLLHGTLALMDYRELGRTSDTFARIFQLGRVLSVPDILNADPSGMDSLSMTIYRVSSGGLLLMLVEQPKGGAQLAKLLPALARGGTDHAALIEHAYPELGGSVNSLSKWWSLQIAALSQPGMEEVRKPADTERLLSEALVLRYQPASATDKKPGTLKRLFSREKSAAPAPAPHISATPAGAVSSPAAASCDITDYARVLALPDPAPVFNQAALALTRLQLRAHPVYRPIIQEYLDGLRLLAKGKSGKSFPATLTRLAETRQRLAATLQGVEDHLDWFEATQSTTPSGAFGDYLEAAENLAKPRAARGDAITGYLDQMEQETAP